MLKELLDIKDKLYAELGAQESTACEINISPCTQYYWKVIADKLRFYYYPEAIENECGEDWYEVELAKGNSPNVLVENDYTAILTIADDNCEYELSILIFSNNKRVV